MASPSPVSQMATDSTLPSSPEVSSLIVLVLSWGTSTWSSVSFGWVTTIGISVVSLTPRSVQMTIQSVSTVPPPPIPVMSTQLMSSPCTAVALSAGSQTTMPVTLPEMSDVSRHTVIVESAGVTTGGRVSLGLVISTGTMVVSLTPASVQTTKQRVSTVPPVTPVISTQPSSSPAAPVALPAPGSQTSTEVTLPARPIVSSLTVKVESWGTDC